ncbi:hypothetical protein E8E14_001808 [Neopestalotiopsis sp. 37M]|nr:hypothetical protein E8E14_001808 [Neopestalotiopsis sp. 37M]
MQLTFATIFAAAVSARTLTQRDAESYAITDFYASCIPHSTLCSYQFEVDAATNCTILLQGPDILPAVALTGCEDPAYSWSVATTDDAGLALSVTTVSTDDPATNVTGVYDITSDELVITNNGASSSQSYVGPLSFTVATA